MSSDGGRLFVTPDSDRTTLAAYSLPNPTPLWTSKARDMYLIGDGGGTLLTQQADANGSDRLVGLDDRTGTQLWSIDTGQVCAVSNSQALLSANGEFATIDIKTGKQTDVEPPSEDEDAECPVVYAGGIGLDSDGHAVKQWIAP